MRTQDSPDTPQDPSAPAKRPRQQVRGGFIVVKRASTTQRLTIKTNRPFEHGSLADACTEAERLAAAHGHEFAVLQEVHAARPSATLPDAVLAASSTTWRGLTALHPTDRTASLSFVEPDGTVLRVRLPEGCLRFLAAALADTLSDQPVRLNTHSERSSGNPTFEVSTRLDGVKV